MDLFLEMKEKAKLYLRERGRPGKDGKSAYEIWLEQGNEGTEEDFLKSLKGETYEPTDEDIEAIAERAAEKVQKPDIPQGMASEDWVNTNFQPKGEYVTDEELEEKLKEVSLEGYATEEWTNENFQPKGNYLEEVPDEYITETELEAKGYQTKTEAANAYQPKGSYATTEQLAQTEAKIPTKVSQLGNDKNYLEAETDPTVPSWAKAANKPTYTKSEVGLGNVDNVKQYSANNPPPYPVTSVNGRTGDVEVEEKGTAQTKVTNHNADEEAHSYILLLIKELRDKFNAFMDSDDDTLDQASELVEYIKANRALIESVTTTKVNVSDIIDNLTTSVSNKPLSAKQGVQLKALIDAIKVPTALSQLSDDSTHRTVTDSEKAAWDAKSDFSGEYADLKNKPTKVTDFTNDAGYQTAAQVQNYAQPKGSYIEDCSVFYGVCSTAADVAAKTVTVDKFELKTGAFVIVKFTNANSASNPTLNVNGTGAKPIYRYGTTVVSTGTTTTGWTAGAVQMFVYDGTGWIRDYWNNTTYSNAALGQGYGTCSTAAATTAKAVTLSSYTLTAGGIVAVKFTNDVPASATMNINSKGAKNIYHHGAAIKAGVIKAGDIATFIYSSQYHLLAVDRQTDITTEEWTFTLEDGSTVTKAVCVG